MSFFQQVSVFTVLGEADMLSLETQPGGTRCGYQLGKPGSQVTGYRHNIKDGSLLLRLLDIAEIGGQKCLLLGNE